jgi:large subunit ribosomal protein L15
MPLNRRLPKHGFHHGRRFPYAIVNVDDLERLFEPNSEVTPETLLQAGLIKPAAGGVKVLGRGEVAKPLRIQANAVSAGARRKIEAAGGTFEVVRDKSSAPQGDAQEGC